MKSSHFWEARAQQYAGEGDGLGAVCSYAMPGFYNWAIDLTQRSALKKLIRSIAPGAQVLDYGCGVGRWTREIARRGAFVTAVDFSATMLAEAERRTASAGLSEFCYFVRADVEDFILPQTYDVIIGVTVLQHVLDEDRLAEVIKKFARGLNPGGQLIIVEAAPTRDYPRVETKTFRARRLQQYSACIRAAGLCIKGVTGVDPMPFKLWIVPLFRRWPRPLALAALGLATLLALPGDLLLARFLARQSWHKAIVSVAAGTAA